MIETHRTVYLTYAPPDCDFADTLANRLQQLNRGVFRYDSDYPPSDSEWQSIYKEIEQASALLFVLSPASTAHKRCQRELEVAREQHKRLVVYYTQPLSPPDEDHWRKNELANATWVYSLTTTPGATVSASIPDISDDVLVRLLKALNPQDMPSARPKAFISYSREDKAFAQQLYLAFDRAEIDIWVDWEDIRTAENFLESIHQGIAQAANFICIESPEYYGSEFCNHELLYAAEQGKRVISVWWREVTDAHVQIAFDERAETWNEKIFEKSLDAIKANRSNNIMLVNRILVSDRPFEDVFSDLSEALRRDATYIERLNFYYNTALSWEGGTNMLLPESELTKARNWLIEAADAPNRPHLHPLITQYIAASEASEAERKSKRLRERTQVIAAISGLLVMAVVMAVLAFLNRNEARRNERIALHNEQLAIQEKERADTQARHTNEQLQTLIAVNETRRVEVGPDPDRPLLVDNTLWGMNANGEIWRLRADTGESIDSPITVGGNLLQPIFDGDYIWVGSTYGDTLTRIDLRDDTHKTLTLESSQYPPLPVNDTWLWILGQNSLIQINRHTLSENQRIPVGFDPRYPVFDGTYIWVVDGAEYTLYRIHHTTGESLSIPLDSMPQSLIYANRNLWFTDNQSNTLFQVDQKFPEHPAIIEFEGQVSIKALIEDSLWLQVSELTASETPKRQLIRVDTATAIITQRIPVDADIRGIYIHDDVLWVYQSSGGLVGFDLSSGQKFQMITTVEVGRAHPPTFTDLHMWIADSATSTVFVIEPQTGYVVREFTQCDQPAQPVFDGANMWIACQGSGSIIRIPALMTHHGQTASVDEIFTYRQPYTPLWIDNYLWTFQPDQGKLVVFDTRTDSQLPTTYTFEVDSYPAYLYAEPYLWVTGSADNQSVLNRFNTTQPGEPERFPIQGGDLGPFQLIDNHIWLLQNLDDLVEESPDLLIIDPKTNEIINELDLGYLVTGFTQDDDTVWVNAIGKTEGFTYRLDSHTGEPLSNISLDFAPIGAPLLVGNSVWVSGSFRGGAFTAGGALFGSGSGEDTPNYAGALLKLDRKTGEFMSTVPLDHSPSPLSLIGSNIWFTQTSALQMVNVEYNRYHDTLTVFDPRTGKTKDWQPCKNLLPPYFDGVLVYAVCIGTPDDPARILAIDSETLNTMQDYDQLGQGAWPMLQDQQGYLWVVYRESSNAVVIEAHRGTIVKEYGLLDGPSPPAFNETSNVWFYSIKNPAVQRVIVTE